MVLGKAVSVQIAKSDFLSTIKGESMKRLWLLVMMALMIPALASANETMVLYNQEKIPFFGGGQQIHKSYYIKESLKRVDPQNPNLLQVKTYEKVTNREGITEYRITFQINCDTHKFTIVRHWSTGFGEDRGLMVDGKWYPVSEYADMVALVNLFCPKNKGKN